MNDSSQLVTAAREFASNIFTSKVNKNVRYHNLEHTQRVVLACEELADYYQLPPEERVPLLVAAWFHDTGFSTGESKGHEDASISLATSFLKDNNADPALVNKVVSAIDATKMPQNPKSLIEQILCDADLFHLGTDEFKSKNELLRQELETMTKEEITKKKWRKLNISFMENHKYFTDYGRRKLQPVKEDHINALKERVGDTGKDKKKNKKEAELETVFGDEVVQKDDEKEKKKQKEKDSQTDRGISTVFRIMANNHVSLSQMADSKANIMISVNSIILSVVISVLLRHLEESPHLTFPTFALVLVCVSTIIYAVRATRPNVTEGTFTREDIQNKQTNLLFFGNFHNMSLTDYDWAMKEMLMSKEYLYGSMVKDLYFLGIVLAKKYKLLRISYNIFMYGLIITVLAYAAAMAWNAYFVEETVKSVKIT
jgi:predicted metal-dependent HD superfamily phosphohydrolase